MSNTHKDMLLGTAKGYMILAEGFKREGNLMLYAHYLNRAKEILNAIEDCTVSYEKSVA
jgi:hypothetical protein